VLLRNQAIQTCYIFSPHLTSASATASDTENPEVASCHSDSVHCFANKCIRHWKHMQIITFHPSLARQSTICPRQ